MNHAWEVRLTQSCSRCGEQGLPTQSRFCLSCGATLADPAAGDASYTPLHLTREVLTSRTAVEGERKEVTILLADVAGSLAMAESLDPEHVHTVMDGFFALAMDTIHAEEGRINQFRGDGFMALFGAPRAHGDDAVRALRAALRVREQVAEYSRSTQARFGLPMVLRMGVHTGTVWVGSIGTDRRKDYTAEGSTVGLAARLEHGAVPGQILVSEASARRTRPFFEFNDLGTRVLRGARDPMRVFELVGPGPHEARFDAERARGLAPFVGRERELARLEHAAERAAAGSLLLVEICGEAGLGKSRLAHEHVQRQGGVVRRLEARCRPGDAQRGFSLWLDLLRRWPEEAPGVSEAKRLAQRLDSRSGEALKGGLTEIVERLGKLLAEAATPLPLAVLLEDAHWIDPSSRTCLESLLATPSVCPGLLIATSRPSQVETDWDARTPRERLELAPLPEQEGLTLARCILCGLPNDEALIALTVRRADGNPLFIEEVSRSLREGASAPVARGADVVAVPETLVGVIASRIDALPDRSKRLLQTAAVVAGPFDVALLREIDREAGPDTAEQLDDLVERGLLARTREGDLEFHHALVREVAYEQLLLSRRRVLHRRLADALTRQPLAAAADGASRIGFHYDLAGEAERAVEYLGRAGNAYLGVYAATEAVQHLRRAWELLLNELPPDSSHRHSVGLSLVAALNTLDRAGEAAAILEVLEGENLGSSDRVRLAKACIASGWISFSERNDVARSRALLERGIELLRGLPEARRVAAAHAYLARIYLLDGEVRRSFESAQQQTEIATAGGDRAGVAFGLSNQAYALCEAGELEPALAAAREAVGLAAQSGSDFARAFAEAYLAKVWVYRGEFERALRAARRGEEAAERSGQMGALYNAIAQGGVAHLHRGEPHEASRCFERLASINSAWPSTLHFLARGRFALGRHREACDLARRCLEREPPRFTRLEVLCTYGLALGLAEPGGADRAEAALCEAVSLADALELRPALAEAHLALAELCQHRGDEERAGYYLDRAVQGFQACGMHFHAHQAIGLG